MSILTSETMGLALEVGLNPGADFTPNNSNEEVLAMIKAVSSKVKTAQPKKEIKEGVENMKLSEQLLQEAKKEMKKIEKEKTTPKVKAAKKIAKVSKVVKSDEELRLESLRELYKNH